MTAGVDVAGWWWPFLTGAATTIVAGLVVLVAVRDRIGSWLDRLAAWTVRLVEGRPVPSTHRGPLPAPQSHLRLVHRSPGLYDQDLDR